MPTTDPASTAVTPQTGASINSQSTPTNTATTQTPELTTWTIAIVLITPMLLTAVLLGVKKRYSKTN